MMEPQRPFYPTLGTLLRCARTNLGLTQHQVSVAARVTPADLSYIERGAVCTAQKYYRIATAIGLGPAHVLRMAAVMSGEHAPAE
jgi:transcriptional regulator with XRE-family HTH domain